MFYNSLCKTFLVFWLSGLIYLFSESLIAFGIHAFFMKVSLLFNMFIKWWVRAYWSIPAYLNIVKCFDKIDLTTNLNNLISINIFAILQKWLLIKFLSVTECVIFCLSGIRKKHLIVKKWPPSLKYATHIQQWWNVAQLYLT